ncbi:MAG: MBL fold metallo-hydrolase [Sandaracinaceae bacterium]
MLGSGTAIPHRARGASGYALVADDGTACLIECGPGSTRRWPEAGITFDTARIVAVTHHHLDHCCDLSAVLFGRLVTECTAPITLIGPVGHRAHVAGLEAVHGAWVDAGQAPRDVVELDDGDRVEVGPFTIAGREVLHLKGSLGLRVEADGASVAFSGDSGPCDALVDLCRGVDVALLECSYPADRETKRHLNARTAAEVAVAAGVQDLVLTHFYPECDGVDIAAQVRAAGYAQRLRLAEDGDRFELGSREG